MRRAISEKDLQTRKVELGANLSITSKAEVSVGAPPTPPPAPSGGTPTKLTADDYATKLLKCIPAETVAAYVTINGILSAVSNVSSTFLWIVFAILTVATAVYAWRSCKVKDLPPPYVQTIIQTIGFVVWVASLGGPFATLQGYQSYYGSVILILYTISVPRVV